MKLLFFFDLLVFGFHFGALVEDSIGGFIAHEAVAVGGVIGKGAALAKVVAASRHYGTGEHLFANSAN